MAGGRAAPSSTCMRSPADAFGKLVMISPM